jgi:hypothetical protein
MLFGFFGKTKIPNRINRKPNARFTVSYIQFRFLFFINRISEKTEIPNRINSVNRMPRPSWSDATALGKPGAAERRVLATDVIRRSRSVALLVGS